MKKKLNSMKIYIRDHKKQLVGITATVTIAGITAYVLTHRTITEKVEADAEYDEDYLDDESLWTDADWNDYETGAEILNLMEYGDEDGPRYDW